MFRGFFLLTAMVASLVLSACGDSRASAPNAPGTLYARIQASKTVRVGVSPYSPPFGMRRGNSYQGFDIDIAESVLRELGIEHIVYVPVTSAQRIPFLRSGEVDLVIASMTQTRGREAEVDFTISYFQDGESLLVHADSPVKTYQDLKGVRVGIEAGTTAELYLKQVAPEAIVVPYADTGALRKALESGRETVIANDLLLLIGIRKQCAEPGEYRIAGQRFTTEPYAIAVPQNESAWRIALNHQLLALWEDGTWQKCADTWFGPGAPYEHRVTFGMVPYPK
jgi:polar amino acid transport system substrate-binding protein